MDREQKLGILGMGAARDACSPIGKGLNAFIYPATTSGGYVPLLKVLMTNLCSNDCAYCIHRVEGKVPRVSFRSDELAKLFMELYRKGWVKGLFLSSGNGTNPSSVAEEMIKTAEILRQNCKFQGYIHLKILPGAGMEYIHPACELASRVSINLEAPSPKRLAQLSSKKNFNEIMKMTKEISKCKEGLLPEGQTTQFVVGAAGETDKEIYERMKELYREANLKRIYFEALRPERGTPFEDFPPTPLWRQNRLYQLDFLLHYGFAPEELGSAFDERGFLSRDKDPKLAMALVHPEFFPVDLATADYQTLLRVPGIGPRTARKIMESRSSSITPLSLKELKKIGVRTKRAATFIKQGYQKNLF